MTGYTCLAQVHAHSVPHAPSDGEPDLLSTPGRRSVQMYNDGVIPTQSDHIDVVAGCTNLVEGSAKFQLLPPAPSRPCASVPYAPCACGRALLGTPSRNVADICIGVLPTPGDKKNVLNAAEQADGGVQGPDGRCPGPASAPCPKHPLHLCPPCPLCW